MPSDVAASRVPDPQVRTEVVFQQAQRAKREASTRLRDGDTQAALHLLRTAQAAVADVVPSAPAAQAEDLRQESGMLDALIDRATRGDVPYAAKMMSADASYKSRTRGRRP